MTRTARRVQTAMTEGKVVDDAPFEPEGAANEDGDASTGADHGEAASDDDDAAGPTDGDGYDARPDLADWEWETAKFCAELDQNDRDNGQRLIAWFGANLAYVSGMGWLTWRGTHWQRDEGELEARRLAQLLVDKIKLEPFHIKATPAQQKTLEMALKAARISDEERTAAHEALLQRAAKIRENVSKQRSARHKFAVSSGNAGKTAAMLTQASSFKSIDQNLLDANDLQFNVLNGTLTFSRIADPEQDLEGEDVVPRKVGWVDFTPHERADMMTKVADVAYLPGATCPKWLAFLDRLQPEADMQRFLQVFHAYAMLVGGNGAQKVAYHFGLGANGKSAFIETLGRLAGNYRTTVSPDTITGDSQRQGQQASPDVARLFNTRFVVVEELPRGVPLKEDMIKAFSGGSKMTARFLMKEVFEFLPKFVAILSGNHKPSISGSDYGIWRRVLLVHWSQTIGDNERIEFPELMAMFDEERAGILNWLVEGALIYMRDGLAPHIPAAVKAFTDDYRKDRDNISVFAEHMVEAAPGETVQAGVLFKSYEDWCQASAMVPAKQRTFGDRMGELGYRKIAGRLVVYQDIRLRDNPKYDGPDAPARQDGDPGWGPGL